MSERALPSPKSESRVFILNAAIELCLKNGYNSLTRDDLAAHAGISKGKIHYVFSTMEKLRHAVMRAAICRELKPIIATGLAQNDPIAQGAPEWLKREAVEALMLGAE